MASASDPIYVLVSTHTQSPDGSTRNETFYMTASLNAYAAQLANNIATPVYNYYISELTQAGVMQQGNFQATPFPINIPAGGPVDFRCEIGIGFQPLATPTRYHLVVHDRLSTPLLGPVGVGGQVLYNWISNQLVRLTPVNLYQGVYFT